MYMKIIDLTHTFTGVMPVYPGDTPPHLQEHKDAENQIVHYSLETGMHVGTHMDAPLHMVKGGKKLSEFPVEKFIANGHLIDARGKTEISADLLNELELSEGDCILIYTGFDAKFRDSDFYTAYPDITPEFAQRLVDLKVSFVGSDAPSPDKAPFAIHRVLLGNEILIIESMNNLGVLLGVESFEVTALPTKFEAEAAHVRVIARINE